MYTQNQIDAVVELLGAELVIKHILGHLHSFKVKTAMELSFTNNGIFTQYDIDLIYATEEIDINQL
jgi:hypothetical protein